MDESSNTVVASQGQFLHLSRRLIAPALSLNEEEATQWTYFCPICRAWYKEPFFKEHYVKSCQSCRGKLPAAKFNQEPYVVKTGL